jgi:hypothetical protein
MNCLKDLKNKENPAFSTKANDLMKKFKQELTTTSKPGQVNPKVNILSNENKQKKESGDLLAKKITTSTAILENKNTIAKKRPSSTTNDLVKPKNLKTNDDSNSSLSKKPKLSFADYKLLKGSGASGGQESKSESLSDSRGSSSSSSCQYEVESDLADSYSPTPKNILSVNSSTTTATKSNSANDQTKQKKIISPPVPLEPLGKILINETKGKNVVAYEPTKIVPLTSSLGTKNIISKYASLIPNSVPKEVNTSITDDDALSKIMKQKGQHKQILYTGKRNMNGNLAVVPKLFDMCVRVLTGTLNELPNRISIYSKSHFFLTNLNFF